MRTRKPHPRDRYFRFLARLNRGGRSNMYGAIPYLAAAFGLDRESAFRVICEWVDAQAAAQAAVAEQPPLKPAAAPKPSAAPAPVPPPSSRGRRPSARKGSRASGVTRQSAAATREPAAVTRKPVTVKRKRPGVRRAA